MPRIAAGTIGGRRVEPESEVEAALRLVRAKRVELARRNEAWTEIPEERLVARGHGWLIDAETDLIYRIRRGDVFARNSASVAFIGQKEPMTFFVSRTEDVLFLDRVRSVSTWSDFVERRERQSIRARR